MTMTTTKPKTATYSVEPQTVATALRAVLFARDSESRRYALDCVQLRLGVNHVSTQATDGRRLATWANEYPQDDDDHILLVPGKDARYLAQRLGAKTANSLSIRVVGFLSKQVFLTWRTGSKPKEYSFDADEGRFPRTQEILDGIDKAVGGLTFKSTDPNLSRGVYVCENGSLGKDPSRLVDCKPWGKHQKVYFDPDFLTEFMATLPEDSEIKLSWVDTESAIHCESGCFHYAFMPLRQG